MFNFILEVCFVKFFRKIIDFFCDLIVVKSMDIVIDDFESINLSIVSLGKSYGRSFF